MRAAWILFDTLLIVALGGLAPSSAMCQNAPPKAELLAAADQAWTARKFDDAFERYKAVLEQDSTSLPALFRVATVLGWRRDLEHSAALFRVYLRLAPRDDDARLGLARTLAWRGDYAQSVAICDSVVARDPRREDALQLRAQALAWSVARSASLTPTVSTTDDSDDNRATTYLVRGTAPSLWNALAVGDASYRVADFGAEHGTSATLRGSSSWSQSDGEWTLRTEVGAARVDATYAPGSTHETRVLPVLGLRLTARPLRWITTGGSITRAPFDETASLMLAGIATTSIEADAGAALGSRVDLSGESGWTRLSGGSGPNSRISGSGSLRWSPTTVASFAANVRGFAYDHAAFDGYFAPKHYLLAELSGRARLGGELGWGLESEIGLGDQTIGLFDSSHGSRFAQRATMAIAYRPLPGFEWVLTGGFANVASPTTISSTDYRAYTLSIQGRLRL